jgi:hypothetical protein
VSRTYLLRSTFPVLSTVLEQTTQQLFSLPGSAKSFQRICGDRNDPDDLPVIQPDEAVSLFDVMALADYGWNVGLTLLCDRRLHRTPPRKL